MKSYVIIGLGRFGAELAVKLYSYGDEVLAIDQTEQPIEKIADRVTRAVVADARDVDVLERLGVENFDRAVVAVGSDLASSALITMNLKTLNVPYIICKAHDNVHRKILERLGADRVIIPEWEMADKLALGLTSAGIMEYIELSDRYGIVEMAPPESWVGKSIRALDIRSRLSINVLAVRQGDSISIPPDIDQPIVSDSTLTLLSSYEALSKLK